MLTRPANHIIRFAGLSLALFLLLFYFQIAHAFNYTRLPNRKLEVLNTSPGIVTEYRMQWRYPSNNVLGSVRLLMCTDPYVLDTCTAPSGASMTSALLTTQTGLGGFSIFSQSANEIVLSRAPGNTNGVTQNLTFSNITNPGGLPSDFYIRVFTYASNNGSGTPNEISSIVSATTEPINITTIVPPILYFCAGLTVTDYCDSVGGNYIDYGELDSTAVKFAASQFGVSTNAANGYTVTVNGPTMTSGNKIIDALSVGGNSQPGTAQFGINLRANIAPPIGADVLGSGIGTVAFDYNTPDTFKYANGDIVAVSAAATLWNTFTASYIVNIPPNQPAGVYNTTITYICTAGF